ncbi:hypothetical protein pb186bvf_002999 [Paramecium bursaria]
MIFHKLFLKYQDKFNSQKQKINIMKQLIENYETVESYCKRKQNELSSVPDIYDEANLDHKQDQEYQNYIINIYQEYQQYHPLIIKEKLRLLFIKYCQIKEENLPSFQLQQYQLTCQQTIQYLLSILNYILQKDENQKIEFYANPQIKIKCYEQKHNLFQTDKHKIYLGQFQSIISKFIHYLTNQMTFDSKGIKIILSLIDYKQPALELFKKSTRNLYNKLIQYLDLEQYLKEELLYELKDESSPFFYKLNKCNYNICFNDYRIKDANGPGFLPVIQRIKGYKGYGNLLMINAKQDEWQNVKIYNCKYEMMLIYKKLSNASFNLFKKGAQFRYISNHQIIKYYQSYRVLFHNIEKSTYNNYFDHYRNFIFLYEQFLQDNQLDITISKQFKQLINEENIKINIFLEGLKQTVDTNYNKQQLIFKIQQNTVESINQYIDESVIKLQENLLKIVQNISDLIQEWINNIYKQSLKKKNNISQNHLDQLKIYLLDGGVLSRKKVIIQDILLQCQQLDLNSNYQIKKINLKFESQSYQQTEFDEKKILIQKRYFQEFNKDVFSYNFNQCQTLEQQKKLQKKYSQKNQKCQIKTVQLVEFSNILDIWPIYTLQLVKDKPNLEIKIKFILILINPDLLGLQNYNSMIINNQMDINNNFQLYIKFVVQQTILNYQGNNFLDSPFNLIESVFIDKRNQKFIKNVLYVPDKDLNQYIDFPKYLAQILSYQLVIIGSRTFDQKIQDRYQQLNNDSLILKDQKKQQTEQIFIQLILSMFQLRKKLRIQKQIDFLYFIQDHWNLDLVNLIFLCKKLKDNPNYIIENNMNQNTIKY